MPRSSRWLSPRSSWVSRPTGASCGRPAGKSAISSLSFPPRTRITSAGHGSRKPSNGSSACSARRARSRMMISFSLTPPRSSAAVLLRPCGVRLWPTSVGTATPAAIPAGSGGVGFILPASPTAPPGASSLLRPTGRNGEVALALLPRALRGGETIVCDKGYAGKDFEAEVGKLGAIIVRPDRADEEQKGPAYRAHPAAHRIGLLDLQGSSQPGASWGPHPEEPGGAHRHQAACSCRLHLPQLRARSSQPGHRRLHCLTWHQSSRHTCPAPDGDAAR